MIIVSSEIFFFKYFDFIKDINIRVLSQSADIASFLIQFSKLVGARKSGNGEIFLYATKRRYLDLPQKFSPTWKLANFRFTLSLLPPLTRTYLFRSNRPMRVKLTPDGTL